MDKILSVFTLAYFTNKQIYFVRSRIIYSEILWSCLFRLIPDFSPRFCSIMQEKPEIKTTLTFIVLVSVWVLEFTFQILLIGWLPYMHKQF